MHSGGNTAIKAEVGPTSGPTWRLSHCAGGLAQRESREKVVSKSLQASLAQPG